MAAKRIDFMYLRQLLQLKHKGISNRKIADLLAINRNTVNDYIRVFDDHALSYQQLLEYTDQDLHDLFLVADTKDQVRVSAKVWPQAHPSRHETPKIILNFDTFTCHSS